MSLVNVDSKNVASAGAAKASTEPLAASRTDDIVIGLGVRTAGKFQTAGSVFVDGVLDESDLQCSSLSISRGGEFHGLAKADRIEISGSLHGDALATEEIVLRSSAIVTGSISAPYVVVHRGASVTGEVKSMERRVESNRARPMPPVGFSKSRPRRGMSLFLVLAAIGLALSGGVAFAWWGGKEKPAVVYESPQSLPGVG